MYYKVETIENPGEQRRFVLRYVGVDKNLSEPEYGFHSAAVDACRERLHDFNVERLSVMPYADKKMPRALIGNQHAIYTILNNTVEDWATSDIMFLGNYKDYGWDIPRMWLALAAGALTATGRGYAAFQMFYRSISPAGMNGKDIGLPAYPYLDDVMPKVTMCATSGLPVLTTGITGKSSKSVAEIYKSILNHYRICGEEIEAAKERENRFSTEYIRASCYMEASISLLSVIERWTWDSGAGRRNEELILDLQNAIGKFFAAPDPRDFSRFLITAAECTGTPPHEVVWHLIHGLKPNSWYYNLDLSLFDLRGHTIDNVNFKECCFSGMDLQYAAFNNCTFVDCNFAGSWLNDTVFRACSFIDCDLDYINFEGVKHNGTTAPGKRSDTIDPSTVTRTADKAFEAAMDAV